MVDDWFRNAIGSQMPDLLLDNNSKIYDYLRPAAVRSLYEDHASGRNDNHKILFSLVVCEQWLRVHAEPVAVLT